MAVPRADLYLVAKRVIAAMNAGTAGDFTTVLEDARRSLGEVFANAQAADDELCICIASTEGQGYRSLFMADSDPLAHGDTLPDHLGPVGQIRIKHVTGDADYKAAVFDKDLTLADIERWRENAGGIYGAAHNAAAALTSGFAIVLGNEIYFTGQEAKAKLANYTRTSREVTDGAMTTGSKVFTSATAAFTSADAGAGVLVDGAGVAGVPLLSRIDTYTNSTTVTLRDANASGGNITAKTVKIAKLQSPEAFEDTVFALAMALAGKRGDVFPFHNIFAQAAANHLALIKSGGMTVPPIEMAQAI